MLNTRQKCQVQSIKKNNKNIATSFMLMIDWLIDI